MDVNRLTRGEQIFAAASALLLLLSFFPLWAKVEVEDVFGVGAGGSERASAWSEGMPGLLKFAAILALIGLVLVIVRLAAPQAFANFPFPLAYLYLGIAGLTFLFLLISDIQGPPGSGFEGFGVEVSRGIVLLISPIFGLAMAAGAYLHMKDEGTATGPVARGPMGGPGPGPAGPPPPPGPGL